MLPASVSQTYLSLKYFRRLLQVAGQLAKARLGGLETLCNLLRSHGADGTIIVPATSGAEKKEKSQPSVFFVMDVYTQPAVDPPIMLLRT
jgi:hypothetical protein